MSDKLIELDQPVAILDEHMLTDEDGNEICYLTPKRLQFIADNNNKRVEETGDECPIVVGHTEEGRPEADQGELLGFARDFFVSRGKKDGERIVPTQDREGKHYIFSKWRVYDEDKAKLKKFPRRSVELWTNTWEIDPIAILGATTPDRPLGLVRKARDTRPSIRILFARDIDMQMEERDLEESNTPLTLAQLQQTPEWNFLTQAMPVLQNLLQVEEQEHGPELNQPETEEYNEPQVGGEEEQPGMGGETEDNSAEQPAEEEIVANHGGSPIRHAAGYPGVNDTHVPVPERMTMSRNSAEHETAVRLRRHEDAFAALAEENRVLRVQLARSARKNDLLELENEGVELDVNEELNIVAPEDGEPLEDGRYRAYINKIRKRFRRFPGTGSNRGELNLAQIGAVPRDKGQASRQARAQAAVAKLSRKPNATVEDYDALIQADSEPVQ